MRLLIFGALGDIGTVVVPLALEDGHQVTAVDLKPDGPEFVNGSFRYIQGDAQVFETVFQIMKESECEGVINLAAIRDPSDYLVKSHNTNVVISWNILRAAAELNINRVCQASSINITGAYYSKIENIKPLYFPLDEEHPCAPDEPYGLSKLIMEAQADAIVRRFPAMRIVSIRPHWALPKSQYSIAWGKANDSHRKHFWGYTNVSSCARAFLLGVTAEQTCFQTGHEACFVVSPKIASNERTEVLLEKQWPNVPLKRKLEGDMSLYDCSKAQRILGWVHEDES